jgi:hypothetical protein
MNCRVNQQPGREASQIIQTVSRQRRRLTAFQDQLQKVFQMAKRAAGKDGVVISQEILALVKDNNAIRGPEVMVALREKFPKVAFNENSCQVAYANARKKLGLTKTLAKRPAGGRRPIGSQRTGRPAAAAAPSAATAPSSVSVDMTLLQAAKTLLKQCNGDATAALSALKTVASLQMN